MDAEFTPIHRPPVGGEYYVFRDTIHNLIEVEDEDDGKYLRTILRTPEVQRLRRIRQNGLGSLVYPSLEGSRFPHALGSFHIARRITMSLYDRQPTQQQGFPKCLELRPQDCFAFSIAALLHDIGHGPLSHLWEECFSGNHEKLGAAILSSPVTEVGRFLLNIDTHLKYKNIGQDVIEFIEGRHQLDYLLPLLEGNLDVDRLDFIARDTKAAGVTYGFHELDWIIRSFRFARLPGFYLDGQARWVLAIDGRKGLSTLIQFLHARENMYKLVYHHKTTRIASWMLRLLFRRAHHISLTTDLECSSFPLKEALTKAYRTSLPLDEFIHIDDSDIWSSLDRWSVNKDHDPILHDLSGRLMARDLFKAFILKKEVYQRLLEVDNAGHTIRKIVSSRLHCSEMDAEYYYAFDETSFDVIGRQQDSPWRDVWIMQSGAMGFEYQTLRDYWNNTVRSEESSSQYLLIVHPEAVQDLAGLVERLSFPSKSSSELKVQPNAPAGYKLVAPLGAEGAWKEVWVGTTTNPGSTPNKLVALKRYKSSDAQDLSVNRDVNAFNLLASPHPNLSTPQLLNHENGDLWILEQLWTGSLEELIRKQGARRDILEIVDIAYQLFSGLAELHTHNLRHTDIKPDNCGLFGSHSGKKNYVLGDFGCLSSNPATMPIDYRLLGTLRTRAPEVILRQSISLKSDVWSMAATMYALCLCEYPFMPLDAPRHDQKDREKREEELRQDLNNIVNGHLAKVASDLPPIIAFELIKCFQPEPLRVSAEEIRNRFMNIYSQLSTNSDPLFRTAWQRAEDIIFRLTSFEGDLPNVNLLPSETAEIARLCNEFADFIPKKLIQTLTKLIDSA